MFDEQQERFLLSMKTNEILLLVEGKKDRKVLENAGLNKIVEISGKQLEKVVDIVKGDKHVVILTDFDSEGIKQYKRLKKLLQADDIRVDDSLRREFKRTFLVNRIEELSSYLR